MNQPRKHIYTFAHRVLAQDAHGEPGLWNIITGDKAYGYLQTRWADAGAGAEPMTGMLWVEPIRVGSLDIQLLRMPDPQAPTEPYFTAFVRSVHGGPLRYFVLERSMDGGAFWAEWRAGGMRMRGADVAEYPADLDARTRLPYPYAASFVDAIVAEAGSAAARPAGVAAAGPVARPGAVGPGVGSTASPVKGFIALGVAIVAAVVMYLATRERGADVPGPSSFASAPPVVRDPVRADLEPPTTEPTPEPTTREPLAMPEAVVEKPAEQPAKPPKTKPANKPAATTSGIEPAAIRKVIASRISRFQYCYENQLLTKPSLAGTITVTFTIDGDGKPTSISTSGLPEISACVTSVVQKLAFPNRSGHPQKVVYPFKFEPA